MISWPRVIRICGWTIHHLFLASLIFLGGGMAGVAAETRTTFETEVRGLDGKTVEDIQIEGLKRIEKEAVLEKIKTKKVLSN